MPQHLITTLTSGEVLITELPSRADAEAELRRIERLRRFRVTDPQIYWRTIDGQHRHFGIPDIQDAPRLLEPASAAV